jgi:GT2 family glycosyltransferase
MEVSVVIATRNRKDDLRRAIASAVLQSVPVEILVLDDGSTDGTSDMVRSEFPKVRLDRTRDSLGCVAQRNRGALLCSSGIIFSIDDDAEFSSPRVVEQTLSGFLHPRVAAIAIPYIEPHRSKEEFQKAPHADAIWVTDSFRGTSHALRRDVFLAVGGYREQIVHQGEETDFCIRLLNNGYVVRLGLGDAINHHELQRRDWRRMDFYGRRNDIMFAWRNVPMPYLPAHLLATTFNGLRCAFNKKDPTDMMQGVLAGYSNIVSGGCSHQPVSKGIYRLHRLLKKHGPTMIADIESCLPTLVISEGHPLY